MVPLVPWELGKWLRNVRLTLTAMEIASIASVEAGAKKSADRLVQSKVLSQSILETFGRRLQDVGTKRTVAQIQRVSGLITAASRVCRGLGIVTSIRAASGDKSTEHWYSAFIGGFMTDKELQSELNRLARLANKIQAEAERRYGSTGMLFFESEGTFYVMDGDAPPAKGASERQKHIRLQSSVISRMGAGAW